MYICTVRFVYVLMLRKYFIRQSCCICMSSRHITLIYNCCLDVLTYVVVCIILVKVDLLEFFIY